MAGRDMVCPLCDGRQSILERGMSFLFCKRRVGGVWLEVSTEAG